ncbi:hypothetical protein D3C87_1340750 [compost metagenome]
MLGVIQRAVAAAKRQLRVVVLRVQRGNADADRQRYVPPIRQVRRISDLALHVSGEQVRAFDVGIGQHDGELLAADAPHQVGVAQLAAQHVRKMLKYAIADGVAPGVVDVLEVVQVAHQHRRTQAAQALDPRELGGDARHEMAAVGQGRQRVRGGKLAQFEFSALAVGDIGDEPVPHHAIVGVAARAGVPLSPPHTLQRQADAELQMPRRQRAGSRMQRRAIGGQVLGMDALFDGGGAGARVFGGELEHVPDARADIREPRAAFGHGPTLEHQAGHGIGKVDDQVRRALEPFGHGAHRADVGGRAHHA